MAPYIRNIYKKHKIRVMDQKMTPKRLLDFCGEEITVKLCARCANVRCLLNEQPKQMRNTPFNGET